MNDHDGFDLPLFRRHKERRKRVEPPQPDVLQRFRDAGLEPVVRGATKCRLHPKDTPPVTFNLKTGAWVEEETEIGGKGADNLLNWLGLK